MATISSMIYLSSGNLPSKMAHSTQIAKMSQAFAQKVAQFELVTSGDIYSTFRGMDQSFQDWYGLRRPFQLVRIPAHLRCPNPFPKDYRSDRYLNWSMAYAYLKAPDLIYTRTPTIANLLLGYGATVLWEWHEDIDPAIYPDLLDHPNLLGVVTISPHLATAFIKQGVKPEKVFVAPSAADLESFLPHQSPVQARQAVGLPLQDKVIVYSGHLYDYKGIPTILDVAALLPECCFVLVGGWQEDVDRVQALCRNRSLKNIQLIGHVPQFQLAHYLYASDILLLPTSRLWALATTTSPLKLFDYMTVKKPIVAAALPNIMALLRDHQNALLVEPDDPHAFKQAIAMLLDNPSFADSLAEQAFRDVQQFTWENRADRILHFAAERLQCHAQPSIRPLRKWVRGMKLMMR